MATQLPNVRVRCWCSQASGILIPSLSHTHFNYAVFFFLLVWGNYKSLITDIDPQNVYLGPSYIIIKAKYNILSCLKIERFFQCHKMVCEMFFCHFILFIYLEFWINPSLLCYIIRILNIHFLFTRYCLDTLSV